MAIDISPRVGSGLTTLVDARTVPAASADQCSAATRIDRAPSALDALQTDLTWGTTRGEGIVVAVVDSGVSASNPHLADAIAGGIDLVGDGAGPYGDLDGHGTAIAGQIAARPVDGSGVVGVAPGSLILSVRVYAGTSDQQIEQGIGPDVARLAEGIRRAADAGAQVINVSLSTSTPSDAIRDAVAYAESGGSLVIASAGNRDQTLSFEENQADGTRYPAGDPGAIGVAAANASGVVGEASIHGPHVSLAAPGSEVLTTSSLGGDCVFAQEPATSFAAGYVSGAAALVASAHPTETAAQLRYRLEATAVRADPDARDDVAGWGLVQPYDAIVLVPGPDVRGPESAFAWPDSTRAPAPAESSVAVVVAPPADAQAIALGVFGGVAAVVALGVVGTVGILRRRRHAAQAVPADGMPAPAQPVPVPAADPSTRQSGLFRDPVPPPD